MIEWTGERLPPGIGTEMAYEHYGRYVFVSRHVMSKRVLDMPSGEGLGSFLLAQKARRVVGIDMHETSLTRARANYHHPALEFHRGNMIEAVPFPDGSFDAITCFEGIECVGPSEQEQVLREFKRLLAPSGMLFISIRSLLAQYGSGNNGRIYQTTQFYHEPLSELLSQHFSHVHLLGQMPITGSIIAPLEPHLVQNTRGMDLDIVPLFEQTPISSAWTPPARWMYCVAVCTNAPGSLEPSKMSHVIIAPPWSATTETLDSERQPLTAIQQADLSAALAAKEAALAEQGHALTQMRATLQTHEATLARKNNDLTLQSIALETQKRLLAAYEMERSTFGAQVGRWLSHQRHVWARPTSPQGKALNLLIRMARDLHGEGAVASLQNALRIVTRRASSRRGPAEDWLYTSALFDAMYYLATYPDVLARHQDPAQHYRCVGWKEGRNPNPLFDTTWYLTHNPDVAQMGIDPLLHYLQHGAQEGRNPSPSFDTTWYLAHNPDVARAGVNPLLHYLQHGAQEGRIFHPSHTAYGHIAAPTEAVGVDRHPLPSPGDAVRSGNRGRVVFLSGEPETPGHTYRVERYACALRVAGYDTSRVRADQDPAQLIYAASQAHVFVLWRVPWSGVIEQAVAAARRAGAVVVFDIDDYMMDPALAHVEVIDGIRSQSLQENTVKVYYSRVQRTMLAADYCTCTTAPLAKALRVFGKPTFVLPNGFDEQTYAASCQARLARRAAPSDGLVRIGYAAGTRTHQKDFAQASSAIARILREQADCRLVLFRHELSQTASSMLDLQEFPEFRGLEAQIEWRPFVPLAQLPLEVARFDISVVPLEVGNLFCEAKSELKYFEAALAGVPTVASPTSPYRAVIRHGTTGFLALTQQEWYDALNQLVTQPALRNQIAQQALHDVLWTFGPERRIELAASTFEQILHKGRVAAPLFQRELSRSCANKSLLPIIPEFEVVFQSPQRALSTVTVIIPLYNYAQYIEEALESVKAQTLSDKDLIVVDDCSTDRSLAVARYWLEKNQQHFNQVSLLQNRINAGLGLTRNAGFSFSEARFVLPLDADNKLLPTCLERCLEAIEHSGAAMVYPIIQQFGDAENLLSQYPWSPVRFIHSNYIDAMALIRKAAWAAVGGYGHMSWLRLGWEDYDLWCKFVEHGLWGVQVPEKLALYRVHQSSMLRTQTEILENKRVLLENMRQSHPWLDVQDGRPLTTSETSGVFKSLKGWLYAVSTRVRS